jgi:hypothetical protein
LTSIASVLAPTGNVVMASSGNFMRRSKLFAPPGISFQ